MTIPCQIRFANAHSETKRDGGLGRVAKEATIARDISVFALVISAALSALAGDSLPNGTLLRNTGLAGSVPMIRDSMKRLGFRLGDVKVLLTMQAHFDHVAAMSEICSSVG